MLTKELFDHLTEKQKIELIEESKLLVFPKNTVLFAEGSKSAGPFFIEYGTVKRYISGVDGKESIFEILGPGDIFGHRILFTHENHFDSSCSITEVRLKFIPKDLFTRFIVENNEFNKEYINLLSTDGIRHIRHSQVVAQLSLRQRTAFYLLYIQSKNLNPENRDVEISREDLANLLGTVKESAVRILHEFKAENALTSSGRKMTITDMEHMKKVAKIFK
ncbi:MAG: Crp/Fnr family transcriptional regulator [Crocinitomicaceae bacterium]